MPVNYQCVFRVGGRGWSPETAAELLSLWQFTSGSPQYGALPPYISHSSSCLKPRFIEFLTHFHARSHLIQVVTSFGPALVVCGWGSNCTRWKGYATHPSEDQIKPLYLSRMVAPHLNFDFQPLESMWTSLVSSQTLRAELSPLHSKLLSLASVKPQEVPSVGSNPTSPTTSTHGALCPLAGLLPGCREQVIREDLIIINKGN